MIGSDVNNQDYNPLKYLKILDTHQNLHEDPSKSSNDPISKRLRSYICNRNLLLLKNHGYRNDQH